MPYQTDETSIDSGKPIELYRFVIGVDVYRYTSGQQAEDSNTNLGANEVYEPLTINRTEPEQSRELARTALTVTMPRDSEIANQFIAFLPSTRATLTIFRQHENQPNDFRRYWKGRVTSVEWKGDYAEITCKPSLMSLKRDGLRQNFGASCQRTLYDNGCGVLKDDFKTLVLLSDVDGEILTGSGEIAATPDADWFETGFAKRSNGQIRFVIAQSGDTVRILTPFNNLLPGETIELYAGCKRDAETCATKFDTPENPGGENFFGFHVNPKKNPYKTGLK